MFAFLILASSPVEVRFFFWFFLLARKSLGALSSKIDQIAMFMLRFCAPHESRFCSWIPIRHCHGPWSDHDGAITTLTTQTPTRQMQWNTLCLCQNSYWKWPFIVDFPLRKCFSIVFCKRLPGRVIAYSPTKIRKISVGREFDTGHSEPFPPSSRR